MRNQWHSCNYLTKKSATKCSNSNFIRFIVIDCWDIYMYTTWIRNLSVLIMLFVVDLWNFLNISLEMACVCYWIVVFYFYICTWSSVCDHPTDLYNQYKSIIMVYLNKGYCENADFFYNSYMTNLNKFFTAYLGIIQNVISDKKGIITLLHTS